MASNPIAMASNLIAMASNLIAMASNPIAMARHLIAMASNPIAMASNLIAMASNLIAMASNLIAMASNLIAMASNLGTSWEWVGRSCCTSLFTRHACQVLLRRNGHQRYFIRNSANGPNCSPNCRVVELAPIHIRPEYLQSQRFRIAGVASSWMEPLVLISSQSSRVH